MDLKYCRNCIGQFEICTLISVLTVLVSFGSKRLMHPDRFFVFYKQQKIQFSRLFTVILIQRRSIESAFVKTTLKCHNGHTPTDCYEYNVTKMTDIVADEVFVSRGIAREYGYV